MSAMKSVTLEVRGLFGELDHLGVEKRVGAALPASRTRARL